jgi:hypothetical protein
MYCVACKRCVAITALQARHDVDASRVLAAAETIVDAAFIDTSAPAADLDEHTQALEHVVAAPLLGYESLLMVVILLLLSLLAPLALLQLKLVD